MKNDIEDFCPDDPRGWRAWLEANHRAAEGVWLIIHKKNSARANLSWSEAVDEALCFGWIDSVKRAIDAQTYRQYFGKRKPGSGWSKINKEKIKKLDAAGLMAASGREAVERAKQNGAWTLLDAAESLEIPPDLDAAFAEVPESRDFFLGRSKSARKAQLQWIALAKRAATRKKRVDAVARAAGEKKNPKGF